MYKLIGKNKYGETQTYKYDQLNNSLLDEQTNTYYERKQKEKCKNKKGYVVRISLGKRCNAACKYCIQEKELDTMKFSTDFVDKLVELTEGNIENVQFWGGEPLIYFDKIIKLYDKFNGRLRDDAKFGICTNGILFKEKHIRDWFLEHKYNFNFNFSHDGPGQILRGPDPLKDENIVKFLRKMFDQKDDNFAVNPVMTKYNQNLLLYNDYIKNILNINITLAESRPIIIVDESSLKCTMSDKELLDYSKRTMYQLLTGKLDNWSFVHDAYFNVVHNLNEPYNVGGRCFVSDKYTIVIDTEGNMIPCQGFSKNSVDQYGNSMYLGNIFDIKDLKELRSLKPANTIRLCEKQDKKCRYCLLANVCSDGCPYSPIKYEEINCKYSYYYMLPIFINVIYKLTNTIITKIEEL